MNKDHRGRYVLLWLAGGAVAFLCALLILPASHVEGHYIPVGNDSFYHARRILDAVRDLGAFYQFDPNLHVPEGLLVLWPWGYDFGVAALTRLCLLFAPHADPMAVMVFIPAVAVFLSIGAIVGIARRLELTFAGSALVVFCFALSPLTQMLHGVGNLDHHYTEFILWLSAIWALLRWLAPASSLRDALLAGAILGVAPAFHTDLFILQIPLVVGLALTRLRGVQTEIRFVRTFAITLCVSTVLVALPSVPVQQWHFTFYELSWFQVYAAFATAAFCLWLARSNPGRKGIVMMFAVAAVLALPGLTQVLLAGHYVSGQLAFLGDIDEVASPFSMAMARGGLWRVSCAYSMLIWLSPLITLGCLFELWRSRSLANTYFWVACALGLALLMSQFRFHYFGSVGLIVPLVIWAERFASTLGAQRRAFGLLVGMLAALAYGPAVGNQLIRPWAPGGDIEYSLSRGIYPTLAQACKSDPGVVLETSDDGNYSRFHADCGVIANNFIITRDDERKLAQVAGLMSLSAEELAHTGVPIKYVWVHLVDMYQPDAHNRMRPAPLADVAASNPRLAVELVLNSRDKIPKEFELLQELSFSGPGSYPHGRLFKLHQAPPQAPKEDPHE